ncbi:ATP-dependent helicase HrpB [Luteococcus sp. Sow4_B9]|uniref:ATP-dependent helicase HrpB n=1 Tax=Luteococcus sp. Sow4_B9 TaxID=3438792 RepID=UPI003F97A99B
MLFSLDTIGAGLPVLAACGDLQAALSGGVVVVQAPPGTGKTTLVPPLVANELVANELVANQSGAATAAGRVVVTQPRRIAARAAARRLAHLSGTRLGEEVGFSVRGESRGNTHTRVEFVTTGVLVRRLLNDPALDGVAAVVLDEVHERSLDSDLAFAMVRELRELRPDLAVVVMSATLDAARWAGLLGTADEPAPVVSVAADLFPLEVRWKPAPPGVQRLGNRGVTFAFLDHMAAVTAAALDETSEGSALVFVPGAWETEQVAERLRNKGIDARALHGSLDARQQDQALADGPGRRAIVATSVAESSLTVPGVRIVVDSGLSREPRFDVGRGMSGLVTVSEARASAEQRAGRAARLGPGLAIRCFPESDWPRMRPFTTPEIATADLTQAALDLACWGAPGGEGMALPDAPPAASLALALDGLRALGAVDDDGRPTARGRQMSRVPADPRLARALLDATPVVGARRAAEAVALLAGDERAPGGDLAELLRQVRRGSGPAASRWRHEADRLERVANQIDAAQDSATGDHYAARTTSPPIGEAEVLGAIVALAHPDRVARRRGGADSTSYLLASGTGVALERGSRLSGQEWLAVAEMGRRDTGDGTGAVVRAAVPISQEIAEWAARGLRRQTVRASWTQGKVSARSLDLLGAIELAATAVPPTSELGRQAVTEALRSRGLGVQGPGLLAWPESAVLLRRRLALLHRELGDPWPAMDEESLLDRVDEWLGPELDQLARGASAARLDLTSALRRLLPWPQAGRLEELVPERLEVPTGSRIRLAYPDDPSERVVLAVKLQECFGLLDTPRIVDGRVPVLMHLLSPAQRPLAVTDDLASFWANAYPSVRAENRGRYSKHPWPEDPLTAPPRRGTSRSGR